MKSSSCPRRKKLKIEAPILFSRHRQILGRGWASREGPVEAAGYEECVGCCNGKALSMPHQQESKQKYFLPLQSGSAFTFERCFGRALISHLREPSLPLRGSKKPRAQSHLELSLKGCYTVQVLAIQVSHPAVTKQHKTLSHWARCYNVEIRQFKKMSNTWKSLWQVHNILFLMSMCKGYYNRSS